MSALARVPRLQCRRLAGPRRRRLPVAPIESSAMPPRSLDLRALLRMALALLVLVASGLGTAPARAAHALAWGDTPKYAPDFRHFDYVNPQAPRGGSLNLN